MNNLDNPTLTSAFICSADFTQLEFYIHLIFSPLCLNISFSFSICYTIQQILTAAKNSVLIADMKQRIVKKTRMEYLI